MLCSDSSWKFVRVCITSSGVPTGTPPIKFYLFLRECSFAIVFFPDKVFHAFGRTNSLWNGQNPDVACFDSKETTIPL